jgi:hypothetical protein
MTRKLIVMLALSFALSACETATPETNSNSNTAQAQRDHPNAGTVDAASGSESGGAQD